MSMASFPSDVTERQIFYNGGWKKVGDLVKYNSSKSWKKCFRFPIVYISPEACGQIQLPWWWIFSPSWLMAGDRERRATIIGDTMCPPKDMPNWLKKEYEKNNPLQRHS